jgi:hypothetical protein
MMNQAATNSEPLRLYAADLLETYRAQRSIFYLPPITELETVLQRLVDTDPSHRRVYRCYLAELAWDRGDDAQCLTLGQSALDPDLAQGGPIDFTLDPAAPRAVLYRMAESYWRTGRAREAWNLCEQAGANGFLSDSDHLFPLLAMTYRKLQAAVTAAQDAPAPR